MVRLAAAFIFIFLFASVSLAAEITYEVKRDGIDFVMDFSNPPANVTMLKGDKNIVFNFETAEPVSFTRQDFFDLPIKSAYLTGGDTYRKKFVVTFENGVIEPKVTAAGKKITIGFPISPDILNAPGNGDNITEAPAKTPVPGTGAYFRMMFGLLVVLAVILGLYWLMKTYLKKQVFSDIPGSGRLLGKVELDVRKSLYFYEIGDMIYIIGVTDSAMTLIDKITDEADMSGIKSGLAKRREFAGYMSFFGKRNKSGGLDGDMAAANVLAEEKIKSLRKK